MTTFYRSSLAAADEGGVVVVGFAAEAARARLGDEFHFPDEVSTPGLIHASAELSLHGLELIPPGFSVGGNFEAAGVATCGVRMRGERLADDRRPRSCEPRKRRFGFLHPPQRAAEKASSSFHGRAAILAHLSTSIAIGWIGS
jgi:hypothetical protein